MLFQTYIWDEEETDKRRDKTRLIAAFHKLFTKRPKNSTVSNIATTMDGVKATILRMPKVVTPSLSSVILSSVFSMHSKPIAVR